MTIGAGQIEQRLDDIEVGQVLEGMAITLTEAHLVQFAGLTGDFYALHMDHEMASRTPFGGRIAHGPLSVVMVVGQIAQRITHLHWPVQAIVGLDGVRFRAPWKLGATGYSRATVTDVRRRASGGAVTLDFELVNQHDDKLVTGRFVLLVDD